MDQPQTRGDFAAYLNRDKQPGDRRPTFEGHVTKPGAEERFALTLWAHEYADKQTGELKTMYSGTISDYSKDADAAAQLERVNATGPQPDQDLGNLSLRPRQVTRFPNGFKDDAPEKDRPDYWGGINFGDGTPVVRVSAWMQKTRYNEPMLGGATGFPQPGKSEADMQAGEPELAELVKSGQVTKGMPKGRQNSKADQGRS